MLNVENPLIQTNCSKSFGNSIQKTNTALTFVAVLLGTLLSAEPSFAQALTRQSYVIDFADRDRALLQAEGFPIQGSTRAQLIWLRTYQPKIKAQVIAATAAYDTFFKSLFPGFKPSQTLPSRVEEIEAAQLSALDDEKTMLMARAKAVELQIAELDPRAALKADSIQRANYCPDCDKLRQQKLNPSNPTDSDSLQSILRKL